MVDIISQLPQELIKIVFNKLTIKDMINLWMGNSYLYTIGKDKLLWEMVAKRDYQNFFSPFIDYINQNRWEELVKYLAIRKIIPIHNEGLREIKGYIIVSPDNTVEDLHNFLSKIKIVLSPHSFYKTLDGFPILNLEKFSFDNFIAGRVEGIALLSTNITHTWMYASYNGSLSSTSRFIDLPTAQFPQLGFDLWFVADRRKLVDITMNELYATVVLNPCSLKKPLPEIPGLESKYTLFHSLSCLYTHFY